MKYIPCNSALLAQDTLFLEKKTFFPKDIQKVRKTRHFRPSPNFSAKVLRATSATLPGGVIKPHLQI